MTLQHSSPVWLYSTLNSCWLGTDREWGGGGREYQNNLRISVISEITFLNQLSTIYLLSWLLMLRAKGVAKPLVYHLLHSRPWKVHSSIGRIHKNFVPQKMSWYPFYNRSICKLHWPTFKYDICSQELVPPPPIKISYMTNLIPRPLRFENETVYYQHEYSSTYQGYLTVMLQTHRNDTDQAIKYTSQTLSKVSNWAANYQLGH